MAKKTKLAKAGKVTGPAYQIIYNDLLKKIDKGNYEPAVPIPSENELAVKFNVSRMTARKSVDMLVAQGYLFRHKGKGTFITGRRNLVRDDISLSARLNAQGLRTYSEVILFETTQFAPQTYLDQAAAGGVTQHHSSGANEADLWWKIERVRFVDDAPAIFERVWIPVWAAPDLQKTDAGRSLAQFLNQTDEIGALALSAEPGTLTKKKPAKALLLKKDVSILLVRGTMSSMDGTPVLYSESWQNTRILPFTLNLLK